MAILSAQEIYEIIAYHKIRDAGRLTEYALVDTVIELNQFTNEYLLALGTDDIPKSDTRKFFFNLIRAKEKDAINLTALPPDIKFSPPPNMGEFGPFWSQVLTEATFHKWRFWNMPIMIDEIALQASRYNNIVISLWRDMDNKEILAYTRHPGTCFMEKKFGRVGDNLHVIFVFKGTGRQIADAYPAAKDVDGFAADDFMYELVEYCDDEDTAVYLNQGNYQTNGNKRAVEGGKLAGYSHGLGFIPHVIVGNAPTLSGGWAPCQRYHEIPIVELLNDFIVLEHMQKRYSTGFFLEVVNPEAVPEDIPVGGSDPAIITVREGGAVNVKHFNSQHQAQDFEISKLENMYRVEAQYPPGRSGISQSSITTGRAEAALQAGAGDDSDITKKRMGWALAEIDRKALAMDKKFFPDTKREYFSKWKINGKEAYTGLEYAPKDLPDTTDHQLIFNPFGQNAAQTIISYLQLFGQKIYDRRTVLEQIPGADVAEIMRRLEEDAEWDMKLQAKLMQLQAEAQGAAQGAGEPTLNPEEVEAGAHAMQQRQASAM